MNITQLAFYLSLTRRLIGTTTILSTDYAILLHIPCHLLSFILAMSIDEIKRRVAI